jgi:iron complex outermembrane receptor protein
MNKKQSFSICARAIALSGVFSTPAFSDGLLLEEVLVTAQKRVESLQDVPIAISAVTGDYMRSNGVMNLENMAPSIPNLHIGQAFATDGMFIRGIGSGINFGFEQAVGQVIDGYFYGRSRFGRIGFLDIERVEVLKGPQGALIGKNTSGGAINITTAKPTKNFEGWISSTYEMKADKGYTAEGVVSGPLSETVSARLAVRLDDRDGYIKNTFTGKDDPSSEDSVSRLTVLWEPTSDLDLTASYSHGEMESKGRNVEISKCGQEYRDRLEAAGYSDLEDCKVNFEHGIDARRPALGEGTFEDQNTEFDLANLTINLQTSWGTLSSLSGYAQYDYFEEQDGERGPLSERALDFAEDYEQISQEFRLTSNIDAPVDYIAGLFYQKIEHDTLLAVHLFGPNTSILLPAYQETETKALFGQVTFHAVETVDITVGARYTEEDKEANLVQDPNVLFDPIQPTPIPVFVSHDVDKDRSESHFSPTLNVSWRPTADSMYYASVRKGFKGGGYDHWMQGDQDSAEANEGFNEEKVTHFELGAKLALAGGAAQLNAALFRSEYDDLQTSTLIDPTTAAFAVGNAATAITQGIEADLKWRVTEGLTITAMGAYLDATYADFETAPCYRSQNESTGCVNGVQDLSDETLQYAPEWSGSINAEYIWLLASGVDLIGTVEVVHSGEFMTDSDNDPSLYQDAYQKYNASLKLTDGEKWELSLIGRNLSNEATITRGTDVPTTSESFFVLVEPPRSLALQAKYSF